MEGADEGEGKEVEVEGRRGRRQIEKGDREERGGRGEDGEDITRPYLLQVSPSAYSPAAQRECTVGK